MAPNGRPGEFELIERYFRPLATGAGALGLMDDAALFRPSDEDDTVVTADIVAAGVHFFADDPPRAIAKKALRVNLSDLAGKGAEPVSYLLTIALAADWTEAWIAEFAAGLAEDQARYGIFLLGGDTSRASGVTTVSITAFGRLPRGTMVHRSGARPGDLVYVSGTVGDAALGLALRGGGPDGEGAAYLVDRYLHPQPRVELAPAVRLFATAAMDVSDGLVGDLGHICKASGVTAEIDAAAIPLSAAARPVVAGEASAFLTALTRGAADELLAAVAPANAATFAEAAREAGVPVTPIGRIVKGAGPAAVLDAAGNRIALGRRSFDHFGSRA